MSAFCGLFKIFVYYKIMKNLMLSSISFILSLILKFWSHLELFWNIVWGRIKLHFPPLWICDWPRITFWKNSLFTAVQCCFCHKSSDGIYGSVSGLSFGLVSLSIITDCLNYCSHRSWCLLVVLQFCCSSVLPCLFLSLCVSTWFLE